jgi:hypothetical protein
MRVGQLLSLVVAAALALGLATASSALALPEFTPTGANVTAAGGVGVVTAGENKATCERNEVVGQPTVHKFLIGPFVLHYVGCTASNGAKTGCALSSPGQASGLILTNTLHIVVVLLIYPSKRHTTNVLLLPVNGKEFAKLVGNECVKETAVTGQLIGRPLPVGVSTTKGKIDFNEVEEKEAVADEATYEGGEGDGEYKGLTAFSISATDASNEEVSASSSTELT